MATQQTKCPRCNQPYFTSVPKRSEEFDYRSEEEQRKAGKDRLNRQVRSGLGSNFSL